MKFFLRLFIASLLFVGGWWLYRAVLPNLAAVALATVLALAELIGPMLGGGAGGGLRLLVKLGASLIAWPLLDLGLQWLGVADAPLRVALAAAGAAALGVLAAGHGSGKEGARLAAVLIASGLSLYGLVQALVFSPLDPLSIAAGCAGIAVALGVARQGLLWPQAHSRWLLFGAAAALVAGGLCALPLLPSLL